MINITQYIGLTCQSSEVQLTSMISTIGVSQSLSMSSIQDIAVTQHHTLSYHHEIAHQIKSNQIKSNQIISNQIKSRCMTLHYTTIPSTEPLFNNSIQYYSIPFIQMIRQVLNIRLNTSHFTTEYFIRFEDTPHYTVLHLPLTCGQGLQYGESSESSVSAFVSQGTGQGVGSP